MNKITAKKIFWAATVIVLQILCFPLVSFAAISTPVPKEPDLELILGKIRDYFFGAVIIVCIFMILWGALDFATSGGNEVKVTNAKRRILYAMVGLIVAAMSMAIVSLVMGVVGVQK